MQQYNSVKQRAWPTAMFIVAFGLLLAFGLRHLYYERQASNRHIVERELQLINQLQRSSIQLWRERHITNAIAVSEDTLFNNSVAHWFDTDSSDAINVVLQKHISNLLRVMQEQRGYNAAYLIDINGNLLLNSDGPTQGIIPNIELDALRNAFEYGHAAVIEPHKNGFFGYPFFGIIAPLYDSGNNALAAVWLVIDVRKSLYPLMEKWPGASASAESNLIMLEGDTVLYLSPLRNESRDDSKLSVSLQNTKDPAVQTVTGMRGLFYGIDYRNQEVIAASGPINNSPWFLVSKIDLDEVVQDGLQELFSLAAPILLVLFGVSLALFYVQRQGWQRERILKNALEKQVRIDALTEVANRRALDENLKNEWARSIRQKTPVSLLMIDIDHFKKFNDKYGHLEGDQCLKHVAQIISKTVSRTTDFVARYGGEEFAVILPDTDLAHAAEVGNRICSAVRIEVFKHTYTSNISTVTVSIGVGCMQPTENNRPVGNISSLIQQADHALYKAKKGGRDQVWHDQAENDA